MGSSGTYRKKLNLGTIELGGPMGSSPVTSSTGAPSFRDYVKSLIDEDLRASLRQEGSTEALLVDAALEISIETSSDARERYKNLKPPKRSDAGDRLLDALAMISFLIAALVLISFVVIEIVKLTGHLKNFPIWPSITVLSIAIGPVLL